MKQGVFLGLVTLDLIYQTPTSLAGNEKRQAEGMVLAAGGPATNAAIAFQGLGSQANLYGAMGCHPLSSMIHDDLGRHGVSWVDLTPEDPMPPPVSSIITATATGDRAVIARNTVGRQVPSPMNWETTLRNADILLIDGHQMMLGSEAADQARAQAIPVVIDAGCWKPGFESVLLLAMVVIASQQFRPPGCETVEAAMAYLVKLGVPYIAVTQGAGPILYCTSDQRGTLSVPDVQAVDTLGAGDIFHGAFCHYYPEHDFLDALAKAAAVASLACESIGTRAWLSRLR
ncbi:MAG: PfkB family carbohydrate kinase [Leptolyngbyaceae cyanobacterium]